MNHYTQLLHYLKSLAESHPLVNTVTQGNADKIDLGKSNIFPLVHLTIEDAKFTNGKTLIFPVTIECLTERDFNKEVITNKFWKQDNEVDNHNETLSIINYMWTSLYRDWNNENITTTEDATAEKIEFARGNVLDGWSLSFDVELPNTDLCLDLPLPSTEFLVEFSSGTGGTAISSLGDEGSYTVDSNSLEAFNATPDDGYRFVKWLVNGIENLTNPLALQITKAYTIVASFIARFALTTSVDGSGTIAPASGTYDDGDIVTIIAEPTDPETTELDRIEENGVSISTTSPVNIVMNAGKSVIAYFKSLNPFIDYDEEFIPDTGNYIMRDLFEGTEIDLSKWAITNPDPTKITFTQNNTLKVFNTGVGSTSFLTNIIKSIGYMTSGVIKFSINISISGGSSTFGLYVDSSNRITFSVDQSTGTIIVYEIQGGAVKQQTTLISNSSTNQFKIVISASNLVTIWQWLGSWVQIGTDQTYNMGTNKVFYATINATATYQNYISIDDLFITNADFNTLNP